METAARQKQFVYVPRGDLKREVGLPIECVPAYEAFSFPKRESYHQTRQPVVLGNVHNITEFK